MTHSDRVSVFFGVFFGFCYVFFVTFHTKSQKASSWLGVYTPLEWTAALLWLWHSQIQ